MAPVSTSEATNPGDRLIAGRYRLRKVLGKGSMGTVWSAYDEVLHRPVAVKELRIPRGLPDLEADQLRERTMREARAIAILNHPNVITVHDVAREGGEPFIVMELMTAPSLSEIVKMTGPLNPGQAAAVADAVAAALDIAHQHGITHRDVKPGNVLCSEDGRIKLTDFGIARNVAEATMTSVGIMLGSPAFIAPEVVGGQPVTRAADLWGLGATLFAAIEGRPPYDKDGDPLKTVNEVLHGEVPIAVHAGPMEPIIRGLMVKDPARRMPLLEVRRRIRPYMPDPGARVFDFDDLTRPARRPGPPAQPGTGAPVRASTPPGGFAQPVGTPPGGAARVDQLLRNAGVAGTGRPPAQTDSVLAADPGPLPFSLAGRPAGPEPVPPRRLRAVLIGLVATILFLLAAAVGFFGVRLAGGAPLLPQLSAGGQNMGVPLLAFTGRDDSATGANGAQGGRYSVKVPSDWTRFAEQRPNRNLPASTVVHYLSTDGVYETTIERMPSFYPDHQIVQYVAALGAIQQQSDRTVPNWTPGNREAAKEISYRTGGATDPGRTTYSTLQPRGNDLWVLSVTVPTNQETRGQTDIYDQIRPSLTVRD
jgi:tRNA A-37 threonylcarbamoyl transferase component Bud32